jgi:hypothetical protein
VLGDDAGAVEHHLGVAAETAEELQFLTEQQVVDVIDPGVSRQVFALFDRWMTIQIGATGIEGQAVVGEFARDQLIDTGALEVDADFRFAVEGC